jgi:hypothetical protein
MNTKSNKWLIRIFPIARKIFPVIAGGAVGFSYYYFIGCTTGSCPIQSNPYIATLYGALIGLVFAIPGNKKL